MTPTNQPNPKPSEEVRRIAKEVIRNTGLAGCWITLEYCIATALQAKQDQIDEAARVIEKLKKIAETHIFCRETESGIDYPKEHPDVLTIQSAAAWLEKNKPA